MLLGRGTLGLLLAAQVVNGGPSIAALGLVAGDDTDWAIEENVVPSAYFVAGSETDFAIDNSASSGFAIVAGSATTYAIEE
jgi:hypothetical protein